MPILEKIFCDSFLRHPVRVLHELPHMFLKSSLFCTILLGLALVPSESIARDVRVLLPDGSPASGASAVSVTKVGLLELRDGRIESYYGDKPAIVAADGRLSIPDGERGRWVFLHDGGWADVVFTPEEKEIPLKAWQQVRGTVEESIRLKRAARVALSLIDPLASRSKELGTVHWMGAGQKSSIRRREAKCRFLRRVS